MIARQHGQHAGEILHDQIESRGEIDHDLGLLAPLHFTGKSRVRALEQPGGRNIGIALGKKVTDGKGVWQPRQECVPRISARVAVGQQCAPGRYGSGEQQAIVAHLDDDFRVAVSREQRRFLPGQRGNGGRQQT